MSGFCSGLRFEMSRSSKKPGSHPGGQRDRILPQHRGRRGGPGDGARQTQVRPNFLPAQQFAAPVKGQKTRPISPGTDGSNPSPSSGESDELRSERRSRRGRVPTFDRRVRCPYRRSPERTGCERSACRRSAWRQSSRCARNQGTKSGNTVGRLKFQEFSNAVAAGPSHISAARRISALDASDGSSAFRAVSAPQTKHMHRN